MSESCSWPTVLYVENNLDDLILFRVAYNKAKPRFHLQEAQNVAEAMQWLESSGQPNILVLLDYSLSGETGIQLVRWLRACPRFKDLKVVIFSGQAHEQGKAWYEAGASYVVDKGTDFGSLLEFCGCLEQCLATSPPNFARILQFKDYQPRPTPSRPGPDVTRPMARGNADSSRP